MKSSEILLTEVKKNKVLFVKVAVFMCIGSLLGMGIPTLIKYISDNGESSLVKNLWLLCTGLIAAGFINYFAEYLADKYYFLIADKMGNSILEGFVAKIFNAQKKNIMDINSDSLLRILTNDLNRLKTGILNYYFLIISLVVKVITLIIFVVLLDWKLALIMTMWNGIFYFASRKLIDKIGKATEGQRNSYGIVLSFVKSTLFGIFDLKYFANRNGYFGEFEKKQKSMLLQMWTTCLKIL